MKCEGSDQEFSSAEAFLVECLAMGLLQAYEVEGPPVPVQEMIRHPLPLFERLTLLELNLGLYDAAYRSLLDGSHLIVVDLLKPQPIQRASMARELYVAFCYSPRATELNWPDRGQSYACGDLFARCLLMPAPWMQRAYAEGIPAEEVAVHFEVPVQMAIQRLSEIECYMLARGKPYICEE
jgi:hypothetical protein